MHENSETIKGRDGQWYNVYDGTPYPLPQIFGFEKQPYSTMEEAENKAAWRSASGYSEDYAKQPPKYGFSNTYQPSPQAKALGKVIEALEDPRNAWMGTGVAGGTIRGLGKLRGRLFQSIGPDAGGFSVPTSQMRREMGIPRSNHPKMVVPSEEPIIRSGYIDGLELLNDYASGVKPIASEFNTNELLRRVRSGRQDLADWQAKRLGFGNN